MSVEEILEEICKIGIRYNVRCVILFGSRAKGTATEKSDIDVAVYGIRTEFDDFEEEIQQIPTLLEIDVVNMEECKNRLLREDIEKYGRKIYEKI